MILDWKEKARMKYIARKSKRGREKSKKRKDSGAFHSDPEALGIARRCIKEKKKQQD